VPRRKIAIEKPPPRPAILRPLGNQLRRLRLERKLSQESLAEKAGLNYKYIGRIELAKADPGADVLVRLARALSIPLGELFATITPDDRGHRLSPPMSKRCHPRWPLSRPSPTGSSRSSPAASLARPAPNQTLTRSRRSVGLSADDDNIHECHCQCL